MADLFLPAPRNSKPSPVNEDDESPSNSTVLTLNDSKNDTARSRKRRKVFTDLVESRRGTSASARLRPSKEEEEETSARTADALANLIGAQVTKDKKNANLVAAKESARSDDFVKYAPSSQGGRASTERVIRVVEAAIDPLAPPTHRYRKQEKVYEADDTPVLQDAPDPLTKEDQANWTIPASISSWKNPNGFTIPLDKRLAADGKGLVPTQVSDKFASFAESLMVAEEQARKAVATRTRITASIADKQREEENERLRLAAAEARDASRAMAPPRFVDVQTEEASVHERRDEDAESVATAIDDARAGRAERDRRRKQVKREVELELKKAAAGHKTSSTRAAEREVSERVALGQAVAAGGAQNATFDARLFDQSEGTSAGFGASDEYNVYSKPLFDRNKKAYRPSSKVGKSADSELAKYRGMGAEAGSGGGGGDGPVQFEKE